MSKVSMEVKINQTDGINFEATTSRGVKFEIKPKDHISPLEYFALGLISCSGVDIVAIPAKQGKTVTNLEISSIFERTDQAPYYYSGVELVYSFDSDGTDTEAHRWVLSSLESYCTTINTVRGVAKIAYSIVHNGKEIAKNERIVSGSAGSAGISADDLNIDVCSS